MRRIVLIEDEKVTRHVLHRILVQHGYRVYSAKNGWDGLQMALAIVPDLIICDIVLPVMDGYKVLEEIRLNALTSTIPFIFLTARNDRADIRKAMDRGADDYIVKPFELEELLKSIRAQETKHDAFAGKYQKKMDEMEQYITISLPHELKTPIAGIIGASNLLKNVLESLPPQDIKEMAQVIHSYSTRMNRLIDNYLLYIELDKAVKDSRELRKYRESRVIVEGGCLAFTRSLITESARILSRSAGREEDLLLEVEETGALIPGRDLKKILEELLNNAINYSTAGSPISIKSTRKGKSFRLSIYDHGRGMTEEQISRIGAFIQFNRGMYEQQGSGLGLAIVKLLTELYDGSLAVESIPDEETVVSVTFPCK